MLALIDTGSTGSMAHIGIIQSLGLKKKDMCLVGSSTSGGKRVLAPRYLVGLAIMSNPAPHLVDPLLVMRIDMAHLPYKFILGMDVLKNSVFTLDGKSGTYTLEF